MKEGARHCDGEFVGRIEMLMYGLPHESMVAGRIKRMDPMLMGLLRKVPFNT
jgi:hypothetical protein